MNKTNELICPNESCKGFEPPERKWLFRILVGMRLKRIGGRKVIEHWVPMSRKRKARPRYRFRTVIKGSKYACRSCGAIVIR